MAEESMGMNGQVNMVLRDSYGYIKEERDGPNTVTDAGIAEVVKLVAGEAADAFTHIAIGTDSGASAVGNTTLGAEIDSDGGSRDTSTVTSETTNTTDDTLQLVSGWNFTGALSITESGVFNDGSAGDMLCRQVFTALPVDDGDSLTITWKVTLDQA